MTTARALLWMSVAVICGLTFAWPAIAPGGSGDPLYKVLAVASLWAFLAAIAAVLWIKACRAPRT